MSIICIFILIIDYFNKLCYSRARSLYNVIEQSDNILDKLYLLLSYAIDKF